MVNKSISYVLLLSLSILIINACSVKKKAVSCIDFSKQEKILKAALDYLIKSDEYRSIFRKGDIKAFVVNPKYVYFSFDRVPKMLKDSILQLGDIENGVKVETDINDCFFERRNNELLKLSSINKSNQVISFTGSDEKFLIVSIEFASNDLTIEHLRNNSFEEDICQEWLFFFILEDGKIKEVIHSSRHC